MNGKLNIDLDGMVSSTSQKLADLQFEEEEEDAFYNKVCTHTHSSLSLSDVLGNWR